MNESDDSLGVDLDHSNGDGDGEPRRKKLCLTTDDIYDQFDRDSSSSSSSLSSNDYYNNNSLDEENEMAKSPGIPTECEPLGEPHEIFSNHLILQEIFKQLRVPDLLNISLVNRLWRFNGRLILRENKKCLVKIGNINPCVDLKNFAEILPQIEDLPFNGVSICTLYNYENEHDCIDCESPSFYSTLLLSRINVKYLQIGWDDDTFCPATQVIELIVKDSASTLQGLYLQFLTPGLKRLSNYFFQADFNINEPQVLFPALKILEIPAEFVDDNEAYPIVKELLCIAPNLKHLLGGIQPTFLEFISLKDKVFAVQEFYFQPGIKKTITEGALQNLEADNEELERDFEATLIFANEHPKLRKLTVTSKYMKDKIQNNPEDAFNQLTETLKLLFESVHDSLEELCICHMDLLLLQRIGIPPLQHVRKLTLYYSRKVDTELGYKSLLMFNFPHYFPQLQSVTLYGKEDVENPRFYLSEESSNNNGNGVCEYVCPFVTELDIESTVLVDPSVPVDPYLPHPVQGVEQIKTCYAKLFPNVKSFSYFNCKHVESVCSVLWATWMDLTSIKFEGVNESELVSNLDVTFTGVPEDSWYGMKGNDYIKSRTEPSITHLTKLKSLRLEINHERTCCYAPRKSNLPRIHCFLSEKGAYCTFGQMPDLTVEIIMHLCNPYQANKKCSFLSHLRPYVKFTQPYHVIREILEEEGSSTDTSSMDSPSYSSEPESESLDGVEENIEQNEIL